MAHLISALQVIAIFGVSILALISCYLLLSLGTTVHVFLQYLNSLED